MGSFVRLKHLEVGLLAASGVASCQWPPAAAAAASCRLPSLQCPGGACKSIARCPIIIEHQIPSSADAGPSLEFLACRRTKGAAGIESIHGMEVRVETRLVHACKPGPHLCSRLRHCSLSRASRLSAFSSCSSSSATDALCAASMPAISLSRSCTWQAYFCEARLHSHCLLAGKI